jgi:hypothetical protein
MSLFDVGTCLFLFCALFAFVPPRTIVAGHDSIVHLKPELGREAGQPSQVFMNLVDCLCTFACQFEALLKLVRAHILNFLSKSRLSSEGGGLTRECPGLVSCFLCQKS